MNLKQQIAKILEWKRLSPDREIDIVTVVRTQAEIIERMKADLGFYTNEDKWVLSRVPLGNGQYTEVAGFGSPSAYQAQTCLAWVKEREEV